MTSIPGYCITREIRIHKLSISPIFTPKTSQKWACMNRRLLAKCAKYSNYVFLKRLMPLQPNFAQWDHQILVVGRPKICPTNPKWRTAAILKNRKNLNICNWLTDIDDNEKLQYLCNGDQFLPREAMLSAVYAVVVCLCVCVCVSDTLRYCIKTAKRRITQTTPHDSPMILVLWRQR